jgi:2-methylcitrate dehydratase PrpD
MALAERVFVHADPAITALGAKHRHRVRVEVGLKNGKRLTRSADTPRGGDENFASPEEIVDKFEKLAVHALPESRVRELRDAVLGVEKLQDAARLATLMSKPGRAA